ncbi:GNAT family N-acetyltransferase [Paenibacillus sp. NFR01]|uniref:GNAT family N-acetyltransferase n=1 Tax=Paenibacillus sp. NFR01 TaxID=1566279 RepID=UPI0008C54B3E|nr:GNAT family N-acetyltransferase [Paenibacillus sp. NFR01]SET20894.1 GNAT acetyltransferase [Paenibacillus sp. NFR01]
MIELEPAFYPEALELLRQSPINTLFAESVLLKKVSGKLYGDHPANPRTFYVVHPYGMSLLFGEPGSPAFQQAFIEYVTGMSGKRTFTEWLQADPAEAWEAWTDSVMEICNREVSRGSGTKETGGQQIERSVRVNFAFDRDQYATGKKNVVPPAGELVRTDETLFEALQGAVVPRYFWRDAKHFASEGAGFTLLHGGAPASTAFSSCRIGSKLEIGIETTAEYRGTGYAYAVCSALIDYCLAHDLEPVWACRRDNEGSYRLAVRLGFRPTYTLPYYRLPLDLK